MAAPAVVGPSRVGPGGETDNVDAAMDDRGRRFGTSGRAVAAHAAGTLRTFASRVVVLVAGGAFIGYALSAFVSGFVAEGSLTGRPAEPAETRAYLDALVNRDVTRLAQLQPAADLGTRAAQLQQADGALPWTTQARTYLGGATLGSIGIYLYVVDVRSPDGAIEQAVPFTFTVVQKKIVRVQ
jgi:hypothetical protein